MVKITKNLKIYICGSEMNSAKSILPNFSLSAFSVYTNKINHDFSSK